MPIIELVVGRIGRPHGIRGEVTVEVRTDTPDERFAPGAVLATEPASAAPLHVQAARWHSGRLLLTFEGVTDRAGAELLRGLRMVVEVADDDTPTDPEEFYDHHLVGLSAVNTAGTEVGTVAGVLHLPGQDVLSVRRPDGTEALVPFVAEIVPEVDVPAGRLVLDPPPGLLDPLPEPVPPEPVLPEPVLPEEPGRPHAG